MSTVQRMSPARRIRRRLLMRGSMTVFGILSIVKFDVLIRFRLCLILTLFAQGVHPDGFQVITRKERIPLTINLINDIPQGQVVQFLYIRVGVEVEVDLFFGLHVSECNGVF